MVSISPSVKGTTCPEMPLMSQSTVILTHMASIYIRVVLLLYLGIKFFLNQGAYFSAWFSSCLTIVGATFFGVIGLYPNMFPSRVDPAFSLTAHNASSSPLTLKIMLVVVIIFVPIVIGYQVWAYNLFKGKVTPDQLTYEESY